MEFFKNIFNKKDEPIQTYSDFWVWFEKNSKKFFNVIKNSQNNVENIEKNFFSQISSKLAEIKDGYFYLVGMIDENTVDLVLTADGNPSNIVFVEELVAAAPKMQNWQITAFKPPSALHNLAIQVENYLFNKDNIFFYDNELEKYPDKISITVLYEDLNKDNEKIIQTGISIFLDNYLGELESMNNVDDVIIINRKETEKELVSITKLKDFLVWKQKEFIEKYDSDYYESEKSDYTMYENSFEDGSNYISVMNQNLLDWDKKASHPWIAVFVICYEYDNTSQMPNQDDYDLMNEIGEEISSQLNAKNGHLNIGREIGKGEREIYFACKDFRQISKVFFEMQKKYATKFETHFEIYKDKYWESFERFER